MPLTRKQKEEVIVGTQEAIKSANAMAMVSYNGLTVEESSELRSTLAEAGGQMRVVPKRLLKIVFDNINFDIDPTTMDGQIALAWADDPVAPAKVLNDFAKKSDDRVKLMAGSLEGNVLTMLEVQSLASLPTREQLLGQLVSVLAGPLQGTVRVLCGAQTNMVQVLQAIADKKQDN